MTIDGNQVRMARAVLRMDVRELAATAGFDKTTVVRVEAGESVRASTFVRLREALETAGAVFLPALDGVHGPAVALKWGVDLAEREREKAGQSGTGTDTSGLSSLAWDDDTAADDTDDHEPDELPPHVLEDRIYWAAHPEKWQRLSDGGKKVLLKMLRLSTLKPRLSGASDGAGA